MKKLLSIMAIMVAITLSGCAAEPAPVPPGYVGIIVTKNGIQPELYGPGNAPVSGQDRLILVESSSKMRSAPVRVIMTDRFTEDRVTKTRIGVEMDFTVNVRFRLNKSTKTVMAMIQDMNLQPGTEQIPVMQVYQKYGNMVVGRISREILGSYTPEEVLGNLDKINKALDKGMKEALTGSPLIISSVSLGPVSLPKKIQDRIDAIKDARLKEAEISEKQKIKMLQKQNERELAKEQAEIQRIDATSLAEQNRILNKSITPEVLRLRELQIREKEIQMMGEALSTGKASTVFIPYGAVNNTGAQMRMFQK